jgi:glycosyltransferase involved in cell wall biosynthesis
MIFMDWFLPGTKAGGPVRSMHSLMLLLKDQYEFLLVTGNTDLGEQIPYSGIIPNSWIVKEGIEHYYFDRKIISNESIYKLISNKKPNLIYLNSFWSYNFSIRLVRMKRNGMFQTPLLLAPRGMLGTGAMGLKPGKKKLFLAAGKLFSWYKNVFFHATQTDEAEDIKKQFVNARIYVAPNLNSGNERKNVCLKKAGNLKLFYLSRIARVKNLHTALKILSRLPIDISVSYDIFGNPEDEQYLLECRTLISNLPPNVTVKFCGELRFDQVQSHLVNYHCLLLPTLNENFGHSIVEALLCGCPAIISDQTPWKDLERNDSGFAIPLDNEADFINAIVSYAKMDEANFRRHSLAANNYIHQKIDLPGIIAQYQAMFHGCLQN